MDLPFLMQIVILEVVIGVGEVELLIIEVEKVMTDVWMALEGGEWDDYGFPTCLEAVVAVEDLGTAGRQPC